MTDTTTCMLYLKSFYSENLYAGPPKVIHYTVQSHKVSTVPVIIIHLL